MLNGHQYRQAIDSFKTVLNEEPSNSAALFNLGLAHFGAEQRGAAKAFWRAAQFVDPTDPNSRQALQFISQSERKMSDSIYDSLVKPVVRSLPLIPTLLINAFGWLCLSWSLLNYLRARKIAIREERDSPKWSRLTTSLALVTLISSPIAFFKSRDDLTHFATVIVSVAPVRSGPSDNFAPLFEIPEGMEMKVLEIEQNWLRVQNSMGVTGWINQEQLLMTHGNF